MTHDIFVQYGQAGTYWDCSMSEEMREDAGVDLELDEVRHISVCIDPGTGEVELNHGYDDQSPPGRAERVLFDTYADDIEAALRSAVARLEDQDYDAFKARTTSPSLG